MKIFIYTGILLLFITNTSNAYSYWWVLRVFAGNTGRTAAARVGVSSTIKKSVNKIKSNPSKSTLAASVGVDIEKTLARKRIRTSQSSAIDISLKAEFGIDLFSYTSNSSTKSSTYLIQKAQESIYSGEMITSHDNDSSSIQLLTKVLDRDPSNNEAKMMIDKIIATYQDWAQKSLNNKDFNSTRKYLLVSQSLMEKLKNNTRQRVQKKLVSMLSASSTNHSKNLKGLEETNKTIYIGSYKQKTYKPYEPKTYSRQSTAKYYTYNVKEGDTVFEVMRQTGVYWKDIIDMNNLTPPTYSLPSVIRLK